MLPSITYRQEKTYEISIGTTMSGDKACAPQLEMTVTSVSQNEVDLHFGVYERMLAEKLGAAPRLQ
ncbi:hypothetical protein LJR230_004021 [Trinickia sp. LjRoot230]